MDYEDFFNVGTAFRAKEDIKARADEYEESEEFLLLKKGDYIVIEINDDGVELYDIKKGKPVYFELSWLDPTPETMSKFSIFNLPPEETIEMGVDFYTKKIMQLSSEGWSTDNEMLDLTPYVRKFEILKQMQAISKAVI